MKHLIPNHLTALFFTALLIIPLPTRREQQDNLNQVRTVIAVAPTYPPVALAAAISGEVKVDVAIKPDGTVASTMIVSGHRLLREGCEDAAKEWQFTETESGTKKRTAQITFAFFAAPPKTPGKKLTTIFKSTLRVEITRRQDVVTTP